MPASSSFQLLIASDGSEPARAAMATAMKFPWPEPSNVCVVVAARREMSSSGMDFFRDAWLGVVEREGAAAKRLLARRWPKVTLSTPDKSAAEAILGEVRRQRAGAIALGWRGHSLVKRLLLGSVSREVVRRSPVPVLVARGAARSVRRILIGYDDSAQSRRAVRLLAAATPRRGMRLMLVCVVEELYLTSLAMLPSSVRGEVASEAKRENMRRAAQAMSRIEAAAGTLRAAGWKVEIALKKGPPLDALLGACDEYHADVLVLGARAKRGLERALLGSVANGALTYAEVPVLIVP